MDKSIILIVDDQPVNLGILNELLSPHYHVKACRTGQAALRALESAPRPDLVLMDVMMPGLDGYETLKEIRRQARYDDIPVIFISGLDSSVNEEKGFKLGAVDYITKPFNPAIVLRRVQVHLELKRSRDLLKNHNLWLEKEVMRRVKENIIIQDMILSMISQLAETRDVETAHHIRRTQNYIEILARHLQKQAGYGDELTDVVISGIVKAAPLHDIGKIGIPDHILLKPGKLTREEFEVMKTHTTIGGNAIRNAIDHVMGLEFEREKEVKPFTLQILEEAERIALYHHEKWDGSGYPRGLKGSDIPLSARLMAVADVFDALTTPRIYKGTWSFEEASDLIIKEKGRQFDPGVVEAFEASREAFLNILELMPEKP
jgi:putative two-component system response regulator